MSLRKTVRKRNIGRVTEEGGWGSLGKNLLLPKADFVFKCHQSCFLVSRPVILSVLLCMGGGGCGWVCLNIQQEQLLDDPERWPR